MKETSLGALLLSYVFCSFSYAFLCGILGHRYDPLSAFSVYAVGCLAAFVCSALWYRPKRIWPPTKDEGLAAVASTTILTSATLALLLPQSLLAVVASKSGALLLPSLRAFRRIPRIPRRFAWVYFRCRLALPLLAVVAVVLSAWRKPLIVVALPLGLAALYVVGYALKLQAVKLAKRMPEQRRKDEFVVAEQLVVAVVTLAIAALINQYRLLSPVSADKIAMLGDWRLWAAAFASYGGGFIGTQLVLHSTPQTVVFPAYRAASLLCALGASAARGELHWARKYWSDWAAIAVALVVVLWASGAFKHFAKHFVTNGLSFARKTALVRWTAQSSYAVGKCLLWAGAWLRAWFGLGLLSLGSGKKELQS